jgi:hypothetical protein
MQYDYIIPFIRLRIGDTDCSNYRYTANWLETSIDASIQALGRWWNFKYLQLVDGTIYRNPNVTFLFPEPPILEGADSQIVALMAAYIILEGSLENSAWNFASWRDAEISYSNLEQARTRNETLARLWTELTSIIKIPQKRLIQSKKSSLPGYKYNPYEY